MTSTTPTPARPLGRELVLAAFLNAPGRTLTNVQLGAIPGVQAFHQRISDLKRRGYVFTSGVKVADGHYAYQLIGRRDGSDATGPLPLLTDAETVDARKNAEDGIKAHPPTAETRPTIHPPRSVLDELAGLRERNAELEAENERLQGLTGIQSSSGAADVVAAHHERIAELSAIVGEARIALLDGLGRVEDDDTPLVELADLMLAKYRDTVRDLQGSIAARDELSRALESRPARQQRAPREPREPRGMTGPQAMAEVLNAEGKPMHSKVIAERVLAAHPDLYGGKTPAATMAAQLATSNVKGAEFVKVSPGCFGLRAWDGAKLAQEPTR